MTKKIAILVLLIFADSLVWSLETACQIVNLRGSVLYNGFCEYSGNVVNTNNVLSLNGIYFLKDKTHGTTKKNRVNSDKISLLNSFFVTPDFVPDATTMSSWSRRR